VEKDWGWIGRGGLDRRRNTVGPRFSNHGGTVRMTYQRWEENMGLRIKRSKLRGDGMRKGKAGGGALSPNDEKMVLWPFFPAVAWGQSVSGGPLI